VVHERPWVILIPILLDMFFLFGPRVSIAPVVGQVVTLPFFMSALGADATAETIRLAEEANLLGLLSAGGVSLPTIVPALGIARGSFVLLDSAASAMLLGVGAILGGTLLGCIYRVLIAQQACEGELTVRRLPAESIVAWFRMVLLAVLFVAVCTLVVFPLAFIAAVVSLATSAATAIVTAIFATLYLAALLYLFFAPDAIIVSRVGPIQAIRQSAAVVQSGVWSALTLAILIMVVLVGMAQVWIALKSQPSWGLALGIVGNAYIASGLVAASMLFYRERMEILLARRP
jgi:hypothetical protein